MCQSFVFLVCVKGKIAEIVLAFRFGLVVSVFEVGLAGRFLVDEVSVAVFYIPFGDVLSSALVSLWHKYFNQLLMLILL